MKVIFAAIAATLLATSAANADAGNGRNNGRDHRASGAHQATVVKHKMHRKAHVGAGKHVHNKHGSAHRHVVKRPHQS